jgi:hypothetical protein
LISWQLREINKLIQNPGDGDDLFFYCKLWITWNIYKEGTDEGLTSDAGHATQRDERIHGNERDKLDECMFAIKCLESFIL